MDADRTGLPHGEAARVRRHKYFAQQNPGAGAIHLLRACSIPLGWSDHRERNPKNKTICQRQMVLFLLCVDKKDATFPVVRKERDVCRGNLSRVNTVAALRFAAIQTPQIAPLPRNGFASSAAGGASPVSPCFLIPPQDKFAKQTCPLQKRNTTQWVVFLFCLVLTEKMRSGKCTTVQSVESSIPQLTI